jgi:RNA polymerase sigma factor (sigma-70 family)
MSSIINLIKNNNLNHKQRNIINKVLYLSYEKWAIKKSIEFKKFHKFKCKNICKDDLIVSGKMGLFKSIKNYNGKSSFMYFSEIYVKGELFKTLTDSFSLSSIPKSVRIKNKKHFSDEQIIEYKKLLTPKLIDYSKNWQFDKIYNKNTENTEINILNKFEKMESIKELWRKIENLEPFLKRIFFLKFDYEFNIVRSNRHISELMCCSEENIRKNLIKTMKILV